MPGREVHGHRLPLDAAVDHLEDRVQHDIVTVALRASAPALQSCMNRQQGSDELNSVASDAFIYGNRA